MISGKEFDCSPRSWEVRYKAVKAAGHSRGWPSGSAVEGLEWIARSKLSQRHQVDV